MCNLMRNFFDRCNLKIESESAYNSCFNEALEHYIFDNAALRSANFRKLSLYDNFVTIVRLAFPTFFCKMAKKPGIWAVLSDPET